LSSGATVAGYEHPAGAEQGADSRSGRKPPTTDATSAAVPRSPWRDERHGRVGCERAGPDPIPP